MSILRVVVSCSFFTLVAIALFAKSPIVGMGFLAWTIAIEHYSKEDNK